MFGGLKEIQGKLLSVGNGFTVFIVKFERFGFHRL